MLELIKRKNLMSKSLYKAKVFLSLASITFVFSCDFRSKEKNVGTIEDNTSVVTWQNSDGTILSQEVYEKGKLPEYKGEKPVNNDKTNNEYQFIGWEPEIKEVIENITYTAVYELVEDAMFSFRLNNDGESYRLIKCMPKSNIVSISIPDEYEGKPVSVIDNYALRGLSWVNSINIPSSIVEINDFAFQNTAITSIVIPGSVKSLGSNLFRDCKYLSSVYFPSGIKNIPEKLFYNCDGLSEISIPSSVTSIGSKAFYNCSNLRSVSISDSVTTIDNKAFNQCEKLSSISLNTDTSNLKEIGEYAFSEVGISTVSLPTSIETILPHAFSNCPNLNALYISDNNSNDVTLDEYSFEGCRSLNTISMPSHISKFRKGAFKDCSSLTSFTLGNDTQVIEESLLQNCTSLTSLNITNPSILRHIGKKSLSNTGISSMDIPPSVSLIGDEAFLGCSKLKEIIFPGDTFSIGSNVFTNCSQLSSFYIPNNTDITSDLISNSKMGLTNSSVTKISLPNSTYSIQSGIFSNFSNLKYNEYAYGADNGYVGYYLGNSSNPYLALIKVGINTSGSTVKIHPDCKVVANNAFSSCNKSYNVDINTNLVNLGEGTFSNSALNRITFSQSVSMPILKRNMFSGCSDLKTIQLPNDLVGMEDGVFSGCSSLMTITLPVLSKSIYQIINYGLLIDSNKIILGTKNFDFTTVSKDEYQGIDTICTNAFSYRYSIDEISIPSSITTIEENAFYGNNIKSTIIGFDGPANLTTIDANAFGNLTSNVSRSIYFNGPLSKWFELDIKGFNSLPLSKDASTSLYFSDESNNDYDELPRILNLEGVEKISNYAFCSVQNIEQVYVEASKLTEIGSFAFYNCKSLSNFGFKEDASGLNSLVSIGESAFENCTSLQIQSYDSYNTTDITTVFNSLNSIGEKAFKNCSTMTSRFYFKVLNQLGANAFNGMTNMSNNNIIFDVNRNLHLGSSLSFIGANNLSGILFYFYGSSYQLSVSSNTFSRNVKLYCAMVNPSNPSTIIDPPNNNVTDYKLVIGDTRAIKYFHYSPNFAQSVLTNNNFFLLDSNLNIVEGIPSN